MVGNGWVFDFGGDNSQQLVKDEYVESVRCFEKRLRRWLMQKKLKIVHEAGTPKNGEYFVAEASHYVDCSEIRQAEVIQLYGTTEDIVNFDKNKKYKIVKYVKTKPNIGGGVNTP